MTPEAERLLGKAQLALLQAEHDADGSFFDAAARCCYMAVFYAAQALLFEREGRVPKTHSGVRSRFGLLAQAEQRVGADRAALLAKFYGYKEIADYSLSLTVPAGAVPIAIRQAEKFVADLQRIIEAPR